MYYVTISMSNPPSPKQQTELPPLVAPPKKSIFQKWGQQIPNYPYVNTSVPNSHDLFIYIIIDC